MMVIGYDDDPAHALGAVPGGLLMENGQIAVAEAMSGEIRVFSSDGRHRFTLAGEGGGPGEFRRLHAIAHGPNGGVCGWDVELARLTK